MKEFIAKHWASALMQLLTGLVVSWCAYVAGERFVRHESVDLGYAEYVVEDYHSTRFRWLTESQIHKRATSKVETATGFLWDCGPTNVVISNAAIGFWRKP